MIDKDYLAELRVDLLSQLDEARGQVSAIGGAIQVVDNMIMKLNESPENESPDSLRGIEE